MTPGALGSRWVQDEVNAALQQVNGGRMRGVIPFVMTRCDEAKIPPLWAQWHRYDATKGYEVGRDGLLRANGLTLSAARIDTAATPSGISRNIPEWVLDRLKTLAGLVSLSLQHFEDVVDLMLKANGYGHVRRAGVGDEFSLCCTTPDGRKAGDCAKLSGQII